MHTYWLVYEAAAKDFDDVRFSVAVAVDRRETYYR